jgi:hypothetical protein
VRNAGILPAVDNFKDSVGNHNLAAALGASKNRAFLCVFPYAFVLKLFHVASCGLNILRIAEFKPHDTNGFSLFGPIIAIGTIPKDLSCLSRV